MTILGIEGGAVLGLPLGGVLATRARSRRSLRLGFTVYAAGMVAVAGAPGWGGWLRRSRSPRLRSASTTSR